MAAKVYFTNLNTRNKSLPDKLTSLFNRAGFEKIIKPRDLVAIKLHFGEPGNLAYIRPPYVRRVVELVKKLKGRPFLTDTNTLYVGKRANAVEHLETAVLHGFDYAVAGAPLIIADGLTGQDYVKVNIDGKHFKQVNIASAVYHADAMVVLTHFKGHELTGFGGAIKNLGMGAASRGGKQQIHSEVLPLVQEEKCRGCGKCSHWCPADAIELLPFQGNKAGQRAHINEPKCLGCGECVVTCPFAAIVPSWKTRPEAAQEKLAEYALGAVSGKEGRVAYVTFLMDVSPNCDCIPKNDCPIVRDFGILAAFDPVALDKACVDIVNRLPAQDGSVIEGLKPGDDKFRAVYPTINWMPQFQHAEKIGLGTTDYELVEI